MEKDTNRKQSNQNHKQLKAKTQERKQRSVDRDESKGMKKMFAREKERGGGTWKKYLEDYVSDLTDEEDMDNREGEEE